MLEGVWKAEHVIGKDAVQPCAGKELGWWRWWLITVPCRKSEMVW